MFYKLILFILLQKKDLVVIVFRNVSDFPLFHLFYSFLKSKAVKEAKEEHFLDEAFSHENINTLSLDSISVSETIRGEEQCIKEELNAASIDVGLDDEEVEDFENFDKKLEEDDIDLYKNQVEGYHIVDTYSRVLFPATFVMFNVTYALVLWLTY